MNEQQAVAETRLHDALDETLESASVPPLPYATIVRAGTRRRRTRRAFGDLAVVAAALLAGVLASAPWSGGSEVTPSAPGTVSSASPESLPVRDKLPTGVFGGAHWSLRIDDYRSSGQYCELWQITVNDRRDPSMKGPVPQGAARPVHRAPDRARRTARPRGSRFSPAGRGVRRQPHTATTPVSRLRGDAVHAWFVLALPYAPGHPASYYAVTLTYLDAHGHSLKDGWTSLPFTLRYPTAR
jgi:hypothetical protein